MHALEVSRAITKLSFYMQSHKVNCPDSPTLGYHEILAYLKHNVAEMEALWPVPVEPEPLPKQRKKA